MGAAACNDTAACGSCHAGTEAMAAFANQFTGLIGTFHRDVPFCSNGLSQGLNCAALSVYPGLTNLNPGSFQKSLNPRAKYTTFDLSKSKCAATRVDALAVYRKGGIGSQPIFGDHN